MHNELLKYPRTKHIRGSMLQTGDNDLKAIPFKQIEGRYVVLEEKVDGANSGISFSETGVLLLQSRGHFLTGGGREKHFQLLRTWANRYAEELYKLLGTRYIMYGEWLYAKHTVYYDKLPHYFMEFDIYDKQEELFLNTKNRQKMLVKYPFIHSVRVLYEGVVDRIEQIKNLIGPSPFISQEAACRLKETCEKQGLNFIKVQSETDLSGVMEGIYIKAEDQQAVTQRYKFVRGDFKTQVTDSETHWLDRPIIENQLKDKKVIYDNAL